MDSDPQSSSVGGGPVSIKSPIHVDLILPDPNLFKPFDDGHATIEVAVLDIEQKKFSIRIVWVKSTHYQGREVMKVCLLSTSYALRRDLDSLWIFTTDEEMTRVVSALERLLAKQGLEVPS